MQPPTRSARRRIARLERIFLALGCCLLSPMALHANVELRPFEGAADLPQLQASAEAACDDGTTGGTFVQRLEDWYGNSFTAACGGGRITSVRFQHMSYGLPGPYLFRLHLVDEACGVVGSTQVLQVDASDDAPSWVEVDTNDLGWCVQGAYQLFLEPLTCAVPLSGEDCFPALVYDASSSTEPGAHCALVSTQGSFDRACSAARSADGRYFDFVLRPQVECQDPQCSTAVTTANWTLVKSLYRTP